MLHIWSTAADVALQHNWAFGKPGILHVKRMPVEDNNDFIEDELAGDTTYPSLVDPPCNFFKNNQNTQRGIFFSITD